MIDILYTDEQLKLRKKAHEFAVNYILPKCVEYDSNKVYPLDIIKMAQKEKLLNVMIPKEYGGQGLGLMERAIISEEFSWACSGISAAMLIQDAIIMPILLSENEELKKFCFKELLNGKLMSMAYTEEEAGSNITAIITNAKKEGSFYILNGSKTFISSVDYASYALVFARIESVNPDEKDKFTMFLVDLNSDGIIKHENIETMGQRANVVSGFDLKDVRVPEGNRLFDEDGILISLRAIEYNRSCCAALANGIARRALEETKKYAIERNIKKRELWKYQSIGHAISDMSVKLEASRLLTWEAIKNMEIHGDSEKLSSYAKLYASETAGEICSDAMVIFGGNGYTNKYPIEKLYRDVKVTQIYEGASQIQKNIIANAVMMEEKRNYE